MSLPDLKPIATTKSGGLLVAALIFVGSFLRIVAPSGASPTAMPQPRLAAKLAQSSETPGPQSGYPTDLADKVRESFGCAESEGPSASADLAHWNVPSPSRSRVHFIIGFVPDPVHTHLSLLFDRDVEALELAVQESGKYAFDRSILPWEIVSHQPSSAVQTPRTLFRERSERESYPGLLIFRGGETKDSKTAKLPADRKCPSMETIFVFLVAETPTSGIRTKQFQNALKIMREIRAGSETAANSKRETLLLLGPNFSGSLDSLSRQIAQIPSSQNIPGIVAYSGTITGAESADSFRSRFPDTETFKVRFASFQENDAYAIQMFARFAFCRGYEPREIAVLTESDTVYGNQSSISSPNLKRNSVASGALACEDPGDDAEFGKLAGDMVYLHFPREISYFRSAYEKQLAAQSQAVAKIPGKSSLPVETGDEGHDDDAVAPYSDGQTTLSQEAVMLGLVNELQKHRIKFTVLLATNPVDQVFLARYLRKNYPQGRIVVTTPDLLLTSQEDTLLSGVLGLNDYSLIPGIGDSLCRFDSEPTTHSDRLFDSSSSVGIYNAMLGLLNISENAVDPGSLANIPPGVPEAPYADYASPPLSDGSAKTCTAAPVLWLTILGHDGYWPIAALTKLNMTSATHALPIVSTSEALGKSSSLPLVTALPSSREIDPPRTRTAWNVTYSLCLAALILHIYLSWTGTFLSNSESKAQFARSHDRLGVLVLAMGAFWLSTCFVLIMCTRNPQIEWKSFWPRGLSTLLWAPLPVFLAFTVFDIGKLRKKPSIALGLAVLISSMTAFQYLLACDRIYFFPYTWSNRMIHFSSGVSPIVPFLLLFAAGYWWAWLSLRGVSIVDLRRPRLPSACNLPVTAARISDTEAEKVRNTAHPLKVGLRIILILLGILGVSLTALQLSHPLQSLEGNIYDIGYSLALAITIAVFLSCLMRLVFTWFDYQQVLSGLDRTPLREAFSRMKRLSWRSMWNPGGSTLRETYRVMSRTLENMMSLKQIPADKVSHGRPEMLEGIRVTEEKLEDVLNEYHALFPRLCEAEDTSAIVDEIGKTHTRLTAAIEKYHPFFPAPKDPKDTLGFAANRLFGRVQTAQMKFGKDFDMYLGSLGRAKQLHDAAVQAAWNDPGQSKPAPQKFWDSVKNFRNIFRRSKTNQIDMERATEVIKQISAAHLRLQTACDDYDKLLANQGGSQPASQQSLHDGLEKVKNAQAKLTGALDRCAALFPTPGFSSARNMILENLTAALEELQKQLANTAGTVFAKVLVPKWIGEQTTAVSVDERLKKSDLEMPRAIEEEFVALVYVNFLQSVLLQMRTLVICAGGMYVLLLCSMSVYPFEPHLALQILSVTLLVVMAAAVGFVYKEMHRDAILGRLTSSTAGELGWDFWLKFVSAGAIPVFSLLAVQFPEIGKFLFSWLEPALQGLK